MEIKNFTITKRDGTKDRFSLDKIMNIAENLTDLSGISWRRRPIRNNLATQSMSHILGYVGNIDDEDSRIDGIKEFLEEYYEKYMEKNKNGYIYLILN